MSDTEEELEPERPRTRPPAASISWWFGIALLLQLGAAFFYLVSGLVVPGPGLLPLWAVWIALTYLLFRWRARGPELLGIPAFAALFWFGYLTAGEAIFGWSA